MARLLPSCKVLGFTAFNPTYAIFLTNLPPPLGLKYIYLCHKKTGFQAGFFMWALKT
jgi:hypothetical protein